MLATIEPDIEIVIDPDIFNPVYFPYLDCMARTQIFYGGASSGKSHFVIGQRTVIDLLRGGRNYMICRQVGRTIRRSVFNQIIRTIADFGVVDLFTVNKSEFTITCKENGYQIFFVGLDDVEKIKSIVPERGVITDIIIEEATETDKNTVKNLMRRQRGGSEDTPKRIVFVFNPILVDHWIFSEYFSPIGWTENQTEYKSQELSILRTWFEHNKFLTQQDKADLLNEQDKYFSDVYTWGKFGVLGNVIFTNWKIADLNDPNDEYYLPDNQRTHRKNGLDFGFASHPAAIGRSHFDKERKRIYVFDEFYETGFTNDMLAAECLRMFGKEVVTCDSAEPKSVRELTKYGVTARGAKKGPDSVNFGIDWLKQQLIIVDKSCISAQNELRSYKWKEGADGKLVLVNNRPIPVKANDHFIDGGLRYAYEDEMNNKTARAL